MKVKTSSRNCFAIDWYDDEAEAIDVGRRVAESGQTYNGGFYHGMSCGRDSSFDTTGDDGRKLFAVTTA